MRNPVINKPATRSMMNKLSPYLLLSLLVCGLSPQGALAETVVRMEVEYNDGTSNIDLKLYDSVTPDHANAFLGFVDSAHNFAGANTPTGSFDNSIVHQFLPDEQISGGLFSFTPPGDFACGMVAVCDSGETEDYQDSLQQVNDEYDDAAGIDSLLANTGDFVGLVDSEFLRPNIRATVSAQPVLGQSSQNQWIINLVHNTVFDFIGVTAFAEVINNTMATVDDINATATATDRSGDIQYQLNNIPLYNAPSPTGITRADLVMVNSAKKLFSVEASLDASLDADVNFDFVLVNTDNDSTITVTNQGTLTITVDNIANSDSLDAPFSIQSDNCTPAGAIAPAGSCTFILRFNSADTGSFSDSFNIDISIDDGSNLAETAVTYPVMVEGSADTVIEPDLAVFFQGGDDPVTAIDAGVVIVEGTLSSATYAARNVRNSSLDITNARLVGEHADEFQLFENCSGASLGADQECLFALDFNPVSMGEKSASIRIRSNDPDTPVLTIPVTAYGDTDTDGIPASEEDAAPNSGDNNGDGIADSLQNHVTSFQVEGGTYITVVTEDGLEITGITLRSRQEIEDIVGDLEFRYGAFSIDMTNFPDGRSRFDLGLIFPASDNPQGVYMYSFDTDGNEAWLQYPVNSLAPAASLTGSDGTIIQRSLVTTEVLDGNAFDFNLNEGAIRTALTGIIITDYAPPSGDGGSSMNLGSLFSLLIVFTVCRLRRRK